MALPSAPASSLSAGVGVSFERVSKRYGRLLALRNISLAIQPGQFVALLGPNGSGKSTLIKVAAQAAQPTSGEVHFTEVNGEAILSPKEARARIGLVGHNSLTYDDLTAEENLAFFAKLYGVADAVSRIGELLQAVGLGARKGSLVRTFSRGMRQRLSIARALLPLPGLLLLDEPTTGLDQSALSWLTEYLRQLHSGGCTILMSTHGASDVLALATRKINLDAGALADGGSR